MAMSDVGSIALRGSVPDGPGMSLPAVLLRWSGIALAGALWFSAAFFGTYIAFFYAGAIYVGAPEQWNEVLPRLYEPGSPAATAAIASHFAAGAILLLLGPIQLIGALRRAAPSFHRWTGRLYVVAALSAGLGGLVFIVRQGTIAGAPMSVAFGIYGALMIIAAVQTYRFARARRLAVHRAWAIRLFALAIGSWLYRVEYGFWFLLDGGGHTELYDGWFDVVMYYFFYVPNLIVAELFIRARRAPDRPGLQLGGAAVMTGAASLILLATFQFAQLLWIPGIATRFAG